jgi:hypothetical protein
MLARPQSTYGHAHVAQKLLMNYRHKWDQERTDLVRSPRSHVLVAANRQTDK